MRYPPDMTSDQFVTFSHSEYQARGGGGGQGGIILYMPEDTPAVSFRNSWMSKDFPGPLGQARLNAGKAMAQGIGQVANGGNAANAIGGTIENITKAFHDAGGVGPMAEQGGLQMAAQFATLQSASHLTSITQGEIYNPNVELIYEGPSMRDYTFTFNFAPKNEGDAAAACDIVREFKTWSAAAVQGQKLKIPHVWHINYSNEYMGKFKPAALMDINVDYNPGLSMHMTFPSGMPIITTMSLTFRECEYVFRKDHQEGRMGY